MIKPIHFAFNHETSENNFYKKNLHFRKKLNKMFDWFDSMVNQLLEKGVNVTFEDKESIVTPDSIFLMVDFNAKAEK